MWVCVVVVVVVVYYEKGERYRLSLAENVVLQACKH